MLHNYARTIRERLAGASGSTRSPRADATPVPRNMRNWSRWVVKVEDICWNRNAPEVTDRLNS